MGLLSEVLPAYQKSYEETVSRGLIKEVFDRKNLPKFFRVRCAAPVNQQTEQCLNLADTSSSEFPFSAGMALGHVSLGHPVVIEGGNSPTLSAAT